MDGGGRLEVKTERISKMLLRPDTISAIANALKDGERCEIVAKKDKIAIVKIKKTVTYEN